MDKLETLTPRELDAAVAEFVFLCPKPDYEPIRLYLEETQTAISNVSDVHLGGIWVQCFHFGSDVGEFRPNEFSTDIRAAFLMESEIEQRGLDKQYAYHLIGVVCHPGEVVNYYSYFDLIHATPRQRCIAALRAAGYETKA